MTPKEYKEMMDYLTRSGVKDKVKFASDINRPEPKIEVQEIEAINAFMKRNPRADGGRIGFAEGDRGKGEYKRDSLSKTEQKKIKDAFPNTKFDFDKYRYGVKKYPDIRNQNITNKDYTKVLRFIKKGYKLGKGEGLTTRGEEPKARGTKLSLQDQEKIKSLFKLPPGEEWDFKTHKYGIKQEGRENLLARMARAVADKKPWKVAADFGSTEGWMILQMNRVFENETKAGVKPNKLTYQPVYKVINGRRRIIGFKDNTVAGGGKFYYGLNRHAKKNATNFINHGDFKLNQKLVDISKRSFNQPNEVITGLLKDKGFTGKVNLNNLINYLSGTEATSAENLKNAVVRHHNSGVAFGSATNDLSLTTQTINKKIVEAEKRIRANNILKEDIQLLKNNNIFVRSGDGKLYGAGAKTPIGQFKQIEKGVETAIRSPDFNVKGLSAFMKDLGIKCKLANGVNCNNPQAYQKSINELTQKAAQGDQAAKATLTKFGNKVATAGRFIKGALGPLALATEVAIDLAIPLNKTLSEGIPFKQAFADTLINKYILGPELQVDKEAEIAKEMAKGEEFAMAKRGERMMLPQSATADAQRQKERMEEMASLYPQYSDQELIKMIEDRGFNPQDIIDQKTTTRLTPAVTSTLTGLDQLRTAFQEQDALQRIADAGGVANLAGGGRAGFSSGTGGYDKLSHRQYLQQMDADLLKHFKRYKKIYGGKMNMKQFAPKFIKEYADGGIAGLSGGDKSGPPPERGPNPQGLPGLLKRVRNL